MALQLETKEDVDWVQCIEADRARQLAQYGSLAAAIPPPMLAGGARVPPASLALLARLSSSGCIPGAAVPSRRAVTPPHAAVMPQHENNSNSVMRFLRIRLLQMAHVINSLAALVSTQAQQIRGSGHAGERAKYRTKTRAKMSSTYTGKVAVVLKLFNDTVRAAAAAWHGVRRIGVQIELCKLLDADHAAEYEHVLPSELREPSFFVQVKIPAAVLVGSSLAAAHAVPLAVRMRWVIHEGSRRRAMERLVEIPDEMSDACRYYMERDAVLRVGSRVGPPAYLGPALSGGRWETPSHAHVVDAIVLAERARNRTRWRRMSNALSTSFPTTLNAYECRLADVAPELAFSDDVGAVEAALAAHEGDEEEEEAEEVEEVEEVDEPLPAL